MRPGGGAQKGAKFERDTGRILSRWLTNGDRHDLFSRNVLSGGAFTSATRRGLKTSRAPGDLMSAHPAAFGFLDVYMVECKHHADLQLDLLFYDGKNSRLGRIVSYAQLQADQSSKKPFIVVKENRRDPLLILNGRDGRRIMTALQTARRPRFLRSHSFENGSMWFTDLYKFLELVNPPLLLLEAHHAPHHGSTPDPQAG